MDMVERYLEAVAAQLPADERDDIVAELRDLILSRIEAKEETLGRPLTDDEREAILREIGHPLVVAARYRKGPDSLIGPELFPYWLFAVKAGLLVLLAVSGITLFLHLISVPADAGQVIAQAFHGFFGAGLTLIGALTVAGAIMEQYAIRPKWLTDWRVKDLSAFHLSDPSQWGAAVKGGSTPRLHLAPFRPLGRPRLWKGGEPLFSAIAVGLFVLWWIGAIHFTGLGVIRFDGEDAVVTGGPIWSLLFLPILLYALAQITVDLFAVARPDAARVQAVARIVLAGVGLWLTWVIFQAGHWFTVSVGAEQVRIAGDWVMLDFDQLRELRDGPRDLARVASVLSLVMSWGLAIHAVSLVFSIFANAWRAVRR
jgi:hypothetical protein